MVGMTMLPRGLFCSWTQQPSPQRTSAALENAVDPGISITEDFVANPRRLLHPSSLHCWGNQEPVQMPWTLVAFGTKGSTGFCLHRHQLSEFLPILLHHRCFSQHSVDVPAWVHTSSYPWTQWLCGCTAPLWALAVDVHCCVHTSPCRCMS